MADYVRVFETHQVLTAMTSPLIYASNLRRAFTAGGIAACGAVTVTHGFETVKIRYDYQGWPATILYAN